MDTLQQTWPLIANHPWPFLTLALLIFGLGWGAARLFYGERLEILKERASSPKPAVAPVVEPKNFSYPSRGRHGSNLLSNTVREAHVGDSLSLSAEVPENSSLHIVLKGLPPIYLEDTSASWTYAVTGVTNWVSGSYHQDMESAEQHFNAEKGTAELKLHLLREGDLTVEIFEEGANGKSFSKLVRVRPQSPVNT